MSRFPKPPTRPKPKSLSGTNDAACEAHDDLLRLVWSKIDLAIKKLFSLRDDRLTQQRLAAEEKYRTRIEISIESAAKLADRFKDERSVALKSLGKELSSLMRKKIAPPDPGVAVPSIESKTLEFPIVETKGTRYEPKRVDVGFIDIACEVVRPIELSLYDSLPHFLDQVRPDAQDRMLRSVWDDDDRIALEVIQHWTPTVPSWHMDHRHVTLWIDVRTTITPVGQLLRELKTARTHAPSDVLMIVVMEEVDPEVRAMLEHENILALSREWLEELD